MVESNAPASAIPFTASVPPAAMVSDCPAAVGASRRVWRLNAVAPMAWFAVRFTFAAALVAQVAVVATAAMPFPACVAKPRPPVVFTTAQPVPVVPVLLSRRLLLSAMGSVVMTMRGLLPAMPRLMGVPAPSVAENSTVPSGCSLVASRS